MSWQSDWCNIQSILMNALMYWSIIVVYLTSEHHKWLERSWWKCERIWTNNDKNESKSLASTGFSDWSFRRQIIKHGWRIDWMKRWKKLNERRAEDRQEYPTKIFRVPYPRCPNIYRQDTPSTPFIAPSIIPRLLFILSSNFSSLRCWQFEIS